MASATIDRLEPEVGLWGPRCAVRIRVRLVVSMAVYMASETNTESAGLDVSAGSAVLDGASRKTKMWR